MRISRAMVFMCMGGWLAFVLRAAAKEDVIQCANLIYGGTHTSRCFSHEFLTRVQEVAGIPTARRFRSVKLVSRELFQYPFAVMTGEKEFSLSPKERENLKRYVAHGGFLLASAGCSSAEWDRCFRRELRTIFPKRELKRIAMNHPVFRAVYEVKKLELTHDGPDARLWGLQLDGGIVLVYSPQGLNDTAHTKGCCCCGGNEISNSLELNVNLLVYALLH
ncbi:MAG: DUF4159 domain-containing protein [Kiritimatiellaeota bacterium]|nr:DUF4159 domain-containing protein [Kiritimatiellota bacterium]